MKIQHVKIGMRVRSTGYCPKQYTPSGDALRLDCGTVVEILPPNIVAVKFDLYPNTVDMIARELSYALNQRQ